MGMHVAGLRLQYVRLLLRAENVQCHGEGQQLPSHHRRRSFLQAESGLQAVSSLANSFTNMVTFSTRV